MDKETIFRELALKLKNNEISRDEVINRLNLATGMGMAGVAAVPAGQTTMVGSDKEKEVEKTKWHPHFSVAKMLYSLGAVIIIVGLVFFIFQIWGDIGDFLKIALTLGLGLLLAVIGSILFKQKSESGLGSVFHLLGGALLPFGLFLTLMKIINELNLEFPRPFWIFVIIFGITFAFYLILSFIHRKPILTFFAIANGTALIYSFFTAIMGGYASNESYEYLTMVVSASYFLLAYAFRDNWNNRLIGLLYLFGSVGFLGVAFSKVLHSTVWEWLYIPIVFLILFLSVYLRSRIILVVSTLFLIAHLVYITNQYFANSLGWPISLIILGFVIVGLGYASFTINRKYIKKT